MHRENIVFFKNQDKSCIMTDLYLNHNIFFEFKDSYNYNDTDVNKILLFKKLIMNILLDIMMQVK